MLVHCACSVITCDYDFTVAILAQGTHWAVADMQAFSCRSIGYSYVWAGMCRPAGAPPWTPNPVRVRARGSTLTRPYIIGFKRVTSKGPHVCNSPDVYIGPHGYSAALQHTSICGHSANTMNNQKHNLATYTTPPHHHNTTPHHTKPHHTP